MKKIIFPLGAIVLALSGCSTVKYDCELKDLPAAKCASMQDAYSTSNKSNGDLRNNRQSVFENAGKSSAPSMQTSDKPFFKGEDSGYQEAGERGTPVFKQPEVHRVWVAPYVDSDGNLRSGEYTYFSTPGQWNYGTTKRSGEASGIFGPSKSTNLGFTPVTAAPTKAPPAPPSTQSQASKQTTGSESVDGITQPMQRIAQ